MNSTARARSLGDLTITRAIERTMRFDPLVFFPNTTMDDWLAEKSWLAPDGMDPDTHELLLPCQSYVVRTSHHTILIDACIGNHKDRPKYSTWHQKTDSNYMDALAVAGVTPDDIDYVMCTHLHGDHVGWNTRLVDGRWVPTFANAKYIFSKVEYEAALNPHGEAKPGPVADSVLPVVASGQALLVASDYALDDEVWLEPSPGHTVDHRSIRLASSGHNAVMTGDMMHTPAQCVHPDWIPSADGSAEQGSATRRACLERWADTDMLVCTAHFPLPSAGRIVSRGDAFLFEYDRAEW